MNKLDVFKAVGEIIVSVGVSAVVGNAIKVSTPADVKLIKKLCIGVGGFVLSSMVGDMATTYTTERIDTSAEKLQEAMTKLNPPQEEV